MRGRRRVRAGGATSGEAGVDAIVPFALLILTLALVVTAHVVVVHLGAIVTVLVGESPVGFLVGG